MVTVRMGQHNISDIARLKPKVRELTCYRLVEVETINLGRVDQPLGSFKVD